MLNDQVCEAANDRDTRALVDRQRTAPIFVRFHPAARFGAGSRAAASRKSQVRPVSQGAAENRPNGRLHTDVCILSKPRGDRFGNRSHAAHIRKIIPQQRMLNHSRAH
jgi:hypothetical protein